MAEMGEVNVFRVRCIFAGKEVGWRVAGCEESRADTLEIERENDSIAVLSLKKKRKGDFVNPSKIHQAAVREIRAVCNQPKVQEN